MPHRTSTTPRVPPDAGRRRVPPARVLGLLRRGCGERRRSTHRPPRADAADRGRLRSAPRRPARQARRPASAATVTPATRSAAAWGDPAIVADLRRRRARGVRPVRACVEANGVGWFVPDDAGGGRVARRHVHRRSGYRPVVAGAGARRRTAPRAARSPTLGRALAKPLRRASALRAGRAAAAEPLSRRQRRPVSRAQREPDQPVDQRGVVQRRWRPTSAGTSTSA